MEYFMLEKVAGGMLHNATHEFIPAREKMNEKYVERIREKNWSQFLLTNVKIP